MRDRRRSEMDYGSFENEQSPVSYQGSRFTIAAHLDNPLEVLIITAFNNDHYLQEALEFTESNKMFHLEEFGLVGTHIEQILSYCDRISKKYPQWKKDSLIVRPVLMWHDIGKKDEEWFGFDERGHPSEGHQKIASDMARELFDIDDPLFHKLIVHHDDHYKLYRDRKESYIKKIFISHFENFTREEMEILVRFGYADRYRPKPDIGSVLKRYYSLKRLYHQQMEWFIRIAKETKLLPSNFRVFS